MARPVEQLTREELAAENKALLRKKAEIAERQAVISAEVAKRAVVDKANAAVAFLSEEEIDQLGSAVKRAKARRERDRAIEAARTQDQP